MATITINKDNMILAENSLNFHIITYKSVDRSEKIYFRNSLILICPQSFKTTFF